MASEKSYALSPLGVELLTKEISALAREGIDYCTESGYLGDIREVLRKANLYHEEEEP